MHFSDRLVAVIKAKNSCLMLGLDPNWEKLPAHLKTGDTLQVKADIFEAFCVDMVKACAEQVCGIKIQMAYFEALGSVGIKAVENILVYAKFNHPELIIMMDAKRGDIGSTSEAYAQAYLGKGAPLAGDCVTVAPYMGVDSIKPFADLAKTSKKGVFVLVKTSNPSSKDIQDLTSFHEGKTVAEYWAGLVQFLNKNFENPNRKYGSLGAVVGATHPEELPKFRKILKSCWLLCPGVGAQGGKIADVLKIRDKDGLGVLIPVSRSVLYASDKKDYLKAAQAEIKKLWQTQEM